MDEQEKTETIIPDAQVARKVLIETPFTRTGTNIEPTKFRKLDYSKSYQTILIDGYIVALVKDSINYCGIMICNPKDKWDLSVLKTQVLLKFKLEKDVNVIDGLLVLYLSDKNKVPQKNQELH